MSSLIYAPSVEHIQLKIYPQNGYVGMSLLKLTQNKHKMGDHGDFHKVIDSFEIFFANEEQIDQMINFMKASKAFFTDKSLADKAFATRLKS